MMVGALLHVVNPLAGIGMFLLQILLYCVNQSAVTSKIYLKIKAIKSDTAFDTVLNF